jgi:poly-beta-1,6-N-acetyl-D-glucosamine synthase
MKIIFWVCLFFVVFVYFGYPLALYIIALFKKKEYRKGDSLPGVSILIPAHNEERVISQKLENVYNLDYPEDKLEAILILDSCTDNTEAQANRFKSKQLKIIKQTERLGKAAALNVGIKEAKGEVLIFTDANSIFKKDALRKLIQYFEDEAIGGVCGRLRYRSGSEDIGHPEAESLYWKYENFIKKLESKSNTLVTANGSIYALRKDLFSDIDEELADDLVLPIKTAHKKKFFIYEPEAEAEERLPQKAEEEFIRRTRLINQGMKATFRLRKDILSSGSFFIFEFICHKLLRWLVPVFLSLVFISNIFLLESASYLLFFAAQIVFYSLTLAGYIFYKQGKRIKIFYLPFYFCLLNLASLRALIDFLSRKSTKTWPKAESTR